MAPWMGRDVTTKPNFIFQKYTDADIKKEFDIYDTDKSGTLSSDEYFWWNKK